MILINSPSAQATEFYTAGGGGGASLQGGIKRMTFPN